MIASTTNQGNILIWHNPKPERWGAFAGGFEEVDENIEYEEREDEFDIVGLCLKRSGRCDLNHYVYRKTKWKSPNEK